MQKGRSRRFHFKQKAAAPVLFYTSRVPEKSVMRARHCLCKARGPAARCPLCRSGTAKALFRPSATVDSGCRDFVPFCCAAGTSLALHYASSSTTQGWLTMTQPEPSNLGIHCVTPSHIRKPEEGKGTGAICGRAEEASAKDSSTGTKVRCPSQRRDRKKNGLPIFLTVDAASGRVPDFCARMGEELRAV